ncbi:hypothetical protein KIW84_020593 [Lathyrus oleraceus]|uniref:TF-B3 domain-containing protein n=2 Tax=Pisum sativum TaxID=3888 RepID=A0A9D5B833_PEA|nr:hypothetical protein KIW84_020593 [Pisum sativum]
MKDFVAAEEEYVDDDFPWCLRQISECWDGKPLIIPLFNNSGKTKFAYKFSMIDQDFGTKVTDYVTLNDSNDNKFEVLVQQKENNLYFTQGWSELHNFYNLRFGAWVTLVYLEPSRFVMRLKDRFGKDVVVPNYNPPRKYTLHREDSQNHNIFGLARFRETLSYHHENGYFQHAFVKWLDVSDVTSGYLAISFNGFGELVMTSDCTEFSLVDDSGHKWLCTVDLVFDSIKYFKIGGQWQNFCECRSLCEGTIIKIGAPKLGINRIFYITLKVL